MKILKRIFFSVSILVILMASAFVLVDREELVLDSAEREKLGVDFIELSHGDVHYELKQPSKDKQYRGTVVFVHGFSTPSYVWDKNVNVLVDAGYRVLRFDLYGRGYTVRPEIDFSIDLFVQQLDGLIKALSINEPFHLVGLSMGGPITTRFTHQNPSKVRSLSLLAPLVETPNRIDLKLLSVPGLGEYLSGVVMMPKIANGLANTVYDVNSYPEWDDNLAKHIRYDGYRRSLLSTLRYLAGKDFLDDYQALAESNIPTQLIWGREDKVVPFNQSEKILKLVDRASIHPLELTGHLPQIEQAGEVNRILLRFFNMQTESHNGVFDQ